VRLPVVTTFVIAHAGANNPSRELSADQTQKLFQLLERIRGSGPRSDLRTFGHGGFGVRLSDEGTDAYLTVRSGVITLYQHDRPPTTYADDGLAEFLRECLGNEIDRLSRPAEDLVVGR
jgi:hypothetical protein